MTDIKNQNQEDRLWEAFQYVSGEMSESRSFDFETRLEHDTELCTAVAEVSLLMAATADSSGGRIQQTSQRSVSVVSAELRPERTKSGSSVRRLLATVVAVCTCICITFLSTRNIEDELLVSSSADSAVSEAETLVLVWMGDGQEEIDRESFQEETLPGDLEVPDWMLAGVTLTDFEDKGHPDMPAETTMPDDIEFF